MDEGGDVVGAGVFGVGMEVAELLDDLGVFEVDADDVVVVTAAFDGGPVDDVVGGSAEGVAEVGLLKDFFLASASTAVGDELFGGEVFLLGAVDDGEEAEIEGVGEGDAEVEIPGGRGTGIFDFRFWIFDWGNCLASRREASYLGLSVGAWRVVRGG